ncbi:FecR family protein [Chitinophaga sp.]|uniref:FecR family protein n=1 Tax=Chitinophaga sp. TaxID=1869181 RepID=UPI002C659E7B|nr:FecR family protein [Chitinophaga sp.]HWV68431.1 FecR family protein [Chitinophaga sp.]
MHPSGGFQSLMDKYLTNSITAKEKELLFAMIRSRQHMPVLEKAVDEALEIPMEIPEDMALREEIFAYVQAHRQPVKQIRYWQRYAAAAAVLLLIATGAYYWWPPHSPSPRPVATYISTAKPGANKAILTLADGSNVTLDSAGNRQLQQGATSVRQQGSQLVYNVQGSSPGLSYNVLRTPRGGQFQVTLPDGTKAWLNAASSIRYPTAFTGKERKIEITGEVYLEVSPFNTGTAEAMPFVVVSAHQRVTVLGTQFNINAYEDEGTTSTTLVAGKIKVAAQNSNAGIILAPDQQAVVAHNSALVSIPVKQVETSKVIAWKNGYFDFEEESLAVVLRLLSRWYNVDFEADPAMLHLKFSAVIARSSQISEVLSLLSATGAVTFREEGNKIKVY